MANAPARSPLEDRDPFWKGTPTCSSPSSHLRRKGQYQQELNCLADRLARSIRYRISVSAIGDSIGEEGEDTARILKTKKLACLSDRLV